MTTTDALDLVRAANPVVTLTLNRQDARRADELLARLQGSHPTPARSHRGRGTRRPLLLAGLAAAVFVAAAGVAVAEDVPPFDSIAAFVGISSANHSATSADQLDPASLTMIEHVNDLATRQATQAGTAASLVLPDTARLVGQLASGRRLYVVDTTTSELCVLTAPAPGTSENGASSIGCGNPLNQSQPTTAESQDLVVNGPNATPPLIFGVARDDVTAVSFMADGAEQTIPVKNNVWAYEGDNSALESLTVHYADGSEQTLDHH